MDLQADNMGSVLLGTGAAVCAAAFGYYFGHSKTQDESTPSQKSYTKSHQTSDPRLKYIIQHSLRLHPVQEKLIEETQKQCGSCMLSSAEELQFLANLCRSIGAKKTLDIGVYTGHSAMIMAMALPTDGKVVAIDNNEDYANVGKPFWKEIGVTSKIDLRIGEARDILENMSANGENGTYDFAFIDADKLGYDTYYESSLKLLRPGGIVAVDNTLWYGKVMDDTIQDADTKAIRALNNKIHTDPRVHVSFLNLGDGTTLAFKK